MRGEKTTREGGARFVVNYILTCIENKKRKKMKNKNSHVLLKIIF